eukprot:scaffold126491_cov54-Phaeocystis_antarctica.AAC.5
MKSRPRPHLRCTHRTQHTPQRVGGGARRGRGRPPCAQRKTMHRARGRGGRGRARRIADRSNHMHRNIQWQEPSGEHTRLANTEYTDPCESPVHAPAARENHGRRAASHEKLVTSQTK